MPYKTSRPRTVGSIFNFPIRPDGGSRAGKGYIWMVSAVEADGDLVLEFAGQHPEQGDEDYPVYRPTG